MYVELYVDPRPPTRDPEELPNFWDSVDARLEYFRKRANNNADAVRMYVFLRLFPPALLLNAS